MADTLLFCGGFFGYDREIVRHLEARGRKVALFDDRPATDSASKALIRLAPSLMRARAERYFDGIIAEMLSHPIRDVLVVKAESLSPDTVRRLRGAFPNARFTIYFWDSYRNMPSDSREKASLFDRVLTFDPNDAGNGVVYRPLFFVEAFGALAHQPTDIDVLFVGTMHGDRFRVLRRIERALPPALNFRKLLYFPAHWLFTVHAARNPGLLFAHRNELIYVPKSHAEITALVARCRIVVDIERPVQSGYTMRTLEMLGARRKLITTNAQVARADFYNPRNIAIVDRNNPVISEEFIGASYEPPPETIVARYSLDGWLDDVLPPG